jgi:hypothetical protein
LALSEGAEARNLRDALARAAIAESARQDAESRATEAETELREARVEVRNARGFGPRSCALVLTRGDRSQLARLAARLARANEEVDRWRESATVNQGASLRACVRVSVAADLAVATAADAMDLSRIMDAVRRLNVEAAPRRASLAAASTGVRPSSALSASMSPFAARSATPSTADVGAAASGAGMGTGPGTAGALRLTASMSPVTPQAH